VKRITLREARQRRGLTQEQLESLSGVTQANISAIERGAVQDPNSSTLIKLADALGLDPRALRFGVAPNEAVSQ
jgi:transcriptional regulator with XRE-family HTH domain